MSSETENKIDFLTVQEVKEELGIDTLDKEIDARLERYIKLADAYLKGAVGENYPTEDERAKELALLVIEDLYDRNSSVVKENNSIQNLKTSLIMQLQAEGLNDV